MNVVVVINGQEAIPVRAIPYVTGRLMSPDVVAKSLAWSDHMERFKGTYAYRLAPSGYSQVLPRDWDTIVDMLNGLQARLATTSANRDVTRSIWLTESTKLLPAGVFVWKDQFEAKFHRGYSPGGFLAPIYLDKLRSGDVALDFSPLIMPPEMEERVMEGFETAIEASAPIDGEIVRCLSRWFDKPLAELPDKAREIAEAYVSEWSELSAEQRRTRAAAKDVARQARLAERFQQAHQTSEGWRWEAAEIRAMRTAFGTARESEAEENERSARIENVDLTEAQCQNLAQKNALTITDWRQLTGVGRGLTAMHRIDSDGVTFRKWSPEDLSRCADEVQDEMEEDNRAAPLVFPCTPAKLLEFVDNAVRRGLDDFSLPDAFRQAVAESAQVIGGEPSASRPLLQQAHQEQEILRVISEMGYTATELPPIQPAKPGVKAAVRKKLGHYSNAVFDKAWERLRRHGWIKQKA